MPVAFMNAGYGSFLERSAPVANSKWANSMCMRLRWVATASAALFTLGATLGASPLKAEEPDPTDVGLGRRVAERLAAREQARREREAPQGVAVTLELGEARFVRELARVDVTLQATNTTSNQVEWTRVLPMDPAAEVIRCALERTGQAELVARTLTFEDGRRLYDETVRPRTQTPARDPLRVEREIKNQLRVTVFPLAPQERVKVRLSFVTPLAGRGSERTYLDPVWLREDEPAASEDEAPDAPITPGPRDILPLPVPSTNIMASLLVEPRGLALAEWPTSLARTAAPASHLGFVHLQQDTQGERRTLTFKAPEGDLPALTVPGGGLSTRVAIWRFDPAAYLASQGLTHLGPRTELQLTPLGGHTQRLVPGLLKAGDPAQPLAARVSSGAVEVRYAVDVLTPEGLRRTEVTVPVARDAADAGLVDAVTAWHRARMARHVLTWAAGDPLRLLAAIEYAVNVGVLLPGTSALAIPRDEQRLLSRASRRLYRTDGALLGSPNGTADFTPPPHGSLK